MPFNGDTACERAPDLDGTATAAAERDFFNEIEARIEGLQLIS